MSYAEKLKSPKWQKRRLEILSRDEFKCQYCFDRETTLHVHHLEYKGNPWDAEDDQLITVCEHCHTIIGMHKKPMKVLGCIKQKVKDYIFLTMVSEFPGKKIVMIHQIERATNEILLQHAFDSNYLILINKYMGQ